MSQEELAVPTRPSDGFLTAESPLKKRYNHSSSSLSQNASSNPMNADQASPPLTNSTKPDHFLHPSVQHPYHTPGPVDEIYDAHAHLLDLFQHSEGIGSLLEAMDEVDVTEAAITGCPLKKIWSENEERRVDSDPYADDDKMYYFSLTDMYIMEAIRQLPSHISKRFAPLLCGFNPSDKSAGEHISSLFDHYPSTRWRGVGEVILRNSDISRLAPRPLPNPGTAAFEVVIKTAAARKVPLILSHNVANKAKQSNSTHLEYLAELRQCVAAHPTVKVLWKNGGVFPELSPCQPYIRHLSDLLAHHPNLFISITPSILRNHPEASADLIDLAERHSDRVVVGSSTQGRFTQVYQQEIRELRGWAQGLNDITRRKVLYVNARRFYAEMPSLSGQSLLPAPAAHDSWTSANGDLGEYEAEGADPHSLELMDGRPPKPEHQHRPGMVGGKITNTSDGLGSKTMPHVSIDANVQLFDLQQRSGGTRALQRAMDGCGVRKALLMGMPVYKKWAKEEADRPSELRDDHSLCYYYSYTDQMVADAWLALPPDQRSRFAPIMGGVNPTDLNAADHLERLWEKYPGLWRGVGKIVFRSDHMGSMVESSELPVINHPGMKRVFEFCVEKHIPCIVHHNTDRRGGMQDGRWDYVWEIEQVLHDNPTLKLVWSQAGISLLSAEESHNEMLDMMLGKYPNLYLGISGDIWEGVICDQKLPKKSWSALLEKHSTRFVIGSDAMGQFLGPSDNNWMRPEIERFWVLEGSLTQTAMRSILYENAQRLFFEGWEVPASEGPTSQIAPYQQAETWYRYQRIYGWNQSLNPGKPGELF